MKKDILISVIMPARNEEKYIARSINSILSQTYTNFEFLILNDCSSDNTGNIIKKFAAADKRIKYLEGEGKGVAAARNILFNEMRGTFVVNADADDFYRPLRLHKLLERALQVGEPCLVGSNHETYRDGRFLRTDRFPTEHADIKKRLNSRFNRYAIPPAGVIGSSELYKMVPVQTKFRIMSDWDQLLRIQEIPEVKLANVNESLYDYFLNSGSLTVKSGKRTMYASFLRDCEIRRKNNLPEFKSLDEYLQNFWKSPGSLMLNSFLITAKYLQQKVDFK